ncbi:bifunctional Zinc finger [Babesia duncani]|uniref:Protein MCM10 homolog n=1 Tax=Babesia duncani TaxID=323732 RepID=A0AAD9UQJ5_9APIC|nr:bifunctional Zinc finger [Babesia duncani]
MVDVKDQAKIFKNGLMANGIHLVMKDWIININEIGDILSDNSTMFIPMKSLLNYVNTDKCRRELSIPRNVDLAIICTIIMSNSNYYNDKELLTWLCSDLQESKCRITIRGMIPPDIKEAKTGMACAILNPCIHDKIATDGLINIIVKDVCNILLIGQVDGVNNCKGVTSQNAPCKNVVYSHEHGEYCKYHLKAAMQQKRKVKQSANDDSKTKKTATEFIQPKFPQPVNILKKPESFALVDNKDKSSAKMNIIANLGCLMDKVMSDRGILKPTATTDSAKQQNNNTKFQNRQEFDTLLGTLVKLSSGGSCDFKKLLGILQLILKKIPSIHRQVLKDCNLLRICTKLLDHPSECIAIESLRIKRALKKALESNQSDLSTPTFIKPQQQKSESTRLVNNSDKVMKDLDVILNTSSKVDHYVDAEKVQSTHARMLVLENMDKAEELKKTIKHVNVMASFCQDCNKWSETTDPVCKEQGHTQVRKQTRKEFHKCINDSCGYRYFSLNGQKPPLCPGCKSSTLISEKTSIYKLRKDYLLDNEKLLDCEIGAYRPADSNSC